MKPGSRSLISRYWFAIAGISFATILVVVSSAMNFSNNDGFINLTGNNTDQMINWNMSRTATTSSDGILTSSSYNTFNNKASPGVCATGEAVMNTTISGVQCAPKTAGFTGSCNTLLISSIVVSKGLITGCT